MRALKLIAFDYDGVIVDSFSHNLQVVNQILKKIGHDTICFEDDIRNLKQMTFSQLGLDLGVPESMVDDLEMRTAEELIRTIQSVKLFHGISGLIISLSKHYKLAIISNTTSTAINKLLSDKGLIDNFVSVYGGDHVGSKADKLKELSENNKIPVDEICMVGDAMSDVEAGTLAKTKTVAVTWGFQSEELLKIVKPDHIVKSIKDLSDLLLH